MAHALNIRSQHQRRMRMKKVLDEFYFFYTDYTNRETFLCLFTSLNMNNFYNIKEIRRNKD